jgi:clan AA aspartic protease (TIGR02281 family)
MIARVRIGSRRDRPGPSEEKRRTEACGLSRRPAKLGGKDAMRRHLVATAAVHAIAAAAAAPPAGAQSVGGGPAESETPAESRPAKPPDVSRIIVRRPKGDIVEPSRYGRGLVVTRGMGGHFLLRGTVDGHPVRFMFDTGASSVVLTHKDAVAAGVPVDRLRFELPVMTANGIARVAPLTIERLSVGTITLADVRAMVAPPGRLDISLRGNSGLNRLGSFTGDGNRHELRP